MRKELVAGRLAWGWSPKELLINHPYLSCQSKFDHEHKRGGGAERLWIP